jgi:hypothetical protein
VKNVNCNINVRELGVAHIEMPSDVQIEWKVPVVLSQRRYYMLTQS